MINIKAITFGTIITVIIFLVNQLIFILAAAYGGMVGEGNEFWMQNKELIWQVMGLLTLTVSMLLGGASIRFFVEEKQALHGFIVGFIISGLFILTSLYRGDLNFMALFVFILGTACVTLAAHYAPFNRSKLLNES